MRPGEPEREAGEILISFLLVVRNEERHVARCLESMLNQTLDAALYEVVVVDGCSTDNTRAVVEQTRARCADRPIRLLDNPGRTLACGWNIGLHAARGTYVIRPDAHGEVPRDFLERNLEVMRAHPEATAVGGVLETVGRGFWGTAIAGALSSRLGVGGSRFRVGGEAGPADTVVFGLYRRAALLEVGGFDERVPRNQDVLCHAKLRAKGAILYFAPSIRSTYYCRDSLSGLWRQMFVNGLWVVRMVKQQGWGTLQARYLAPLVFVASVIGLLVAGLVWPWAAAGGLAILLLHWCAGWFAASRMRLSVRQKAYLPVVFAIMHSAYGIGSLVGLLTLPFYNPGAARSAMREDPRR